jgi:hypothetical protein
LIIQPAIPGGHVVFCDEVRQEINGKLLYIGVYNTDMVVAGPAPAILTQLCGIVSIRLPTVEANTKLVVKMSQSGRSEPLVVIEAELTPTDLTTLSAIPPMIDDEPEAKTVAQMFSILMAQNIEITENCVFRIRAYVGDDEIRLGALRVRIVGPAENFGPTSE